MLNADGPGFESTVKFSILSTLNELIEYLPITNQSQRPG